MPKWRDVKVVTKRSLWNADIPQPTLISGGFPCQPHSCAGKRRASGDERDLWPELRRVICEIKPRWFLGENVAGLRSSENGRFFGGILRDLAAMGYVVGWGSWEAADVGAPHHRERIFIVAYLNGGSSGDGMQGKRVLRESPLTEINTGAQPLTNSYKSGCTQTRVPETEERLKDADNCGTITDMHKRGLQRYRQHGERPRECTFGAGTWKESWIEVATRLCRVDDGIPSRVDRLKCLGNAVVPQQVYPILKAIADIENGVI